MALPEASVYPPEMPQALRESSLPDFLAAGLRPPNLDTIVAFPQEGKLFTALLVSRVRIPADRLDHLTALMRNGIDLSLQNRKEAEPTHVPRMQ